MGGRLSIDLENNRLPWLDNARILSVFAVVIVHAAALFMAGYEVGTYHWWLGNVVSSAFRWCIPVFVMISGALLLDPSKAETSSIFYRKRLLRILIPLIFWSIIYLINSWSQGNLGYGQGVWWEIAKRLLLGKPGYHLWYLYMICGLYFFTPFFRKLIGNSTPKEFKLLVYIMLMLTLVNSVLKAMFPDIPSTIFSLFIYYLPLYFLGYFIRISDLKPSKWLLILSFLSGWVNTFLGCYVISVPDNVMSGIYFHGDLSVTVVLMAISVMYLLMKDSRPFINSKITQQLAQLSFGVYLIHPLFLGFFARLGQEFMIVYPIISLTVLIISTTLLSLQSAMLIGKAKYFKRTI